MSEIHPESPATTGGGAHVQWDPAPLPPVASASPAMQRQLAEVTAERAVAGLRFVPAAAPSQEVTPEELAPRMHAAYRRAYMAQVPGMPCSAWDEMPVTHGPRVAVAVQAGWLAAARDAMERIGQEAAPGASGQAGDLATTQAIARMLQALAIEIMGSLRPHCTDPDCRDMRAEGITRERVATWRARAGLEPQ